jgi:hypothetical protein
MVLQSLEDVVIQCVGIQQLYLQVNIKQIARTLQICFVFSRIPYVSPHHALLTSDRDQVASSRVQLV